MKQDILDRLYSKLGQLLAQGWADTFKAGDIDVGQVARHGQVS
jgi:hypothetical protein